MSVAPIDVILSGAPGRMATAIATVALEPAYRGRLRLAPFALAGDARRGQRHELAFGYSPDLIAAEDLPSAIDRTRLHRALVVDYSTPHGALENIRCFIGADVSFVMGTTGFDREEAVRMVRASSVNAVLAPNMAAPIVALQAILGDAARRFPGVLDGWSLSIRESHQQTKRDVSGTARAVQPLLEQLGAQALDSIESIRDQERQRALGVPADAMAGHGWHWYSMASPAGDVELDLSHRINGRRVYAEGTLRAVEFLAPRSLGEHGAVYTMIDVISSS